MTKDTLKLFADFFTLREAFRVAKKQAEDAATAANEAQAKWQAVCNNIGKLGLVSSGQMSNDMRDRFIRLEIDTRPVALHISVRDGKVDIREIKVEDARAIQI